MRDAASLSAELYGIGVGPGDPGLLTLEAARVLALVDIVFAPTPREGDSSLAWEIARGAGAVDAELRLLSFPMSRNASELSSSWSEAARQVALELDRGRRAAFVTLGDSSVYSTWSYLRRELTAIRPGTRIEAIPGITALGAAAAKLGIPLVEGDERFALLPLPPELEELDSFLTLVDTLGIYKIGSRLEELSSYLRERGLEDRSHLAVGVGLERERLGAFAEAARGADGYLSLAIVRTGRKR
jgi:precorrin-2/cobalt-factor-2 C20-methyltransferase